MNKSDLIKELAETLGSQTEAKKAVDGFINAVSKALAKKEDVTLIGFGTFKTHERKATTGRNPQTGESIKIKAKNVPKFVPGKKLKEAVL